MFQNMEKRRRMIYKRALCISVRQTNLSRATTLPCYGTGPSPKLNCVSAGSLVYYIRAVEPQNPGCRKRYATV
jgi:hypothetical protein